MFLLNYNIKVYFGLQNQSWKGSEPSRMNRHVQEFPAFWYVISPAQICWAGFLDASHLLLVRAR